MYYNIYIKNVEPEKIMGRFWLNPSNGTAYFCVNNQWLAIAGGEPVSNFKEGLYWKKASIQSDIPSNPSLGDIWIDENQAYIYIDTWKVFAGG